MRHLRGMDVCDVAVHVPKTLGRATSVARARAAFDDDHVHLLLVTGDDGRLLGTLGRGDLPAAGEDGAVPALDYAVLQDRTVASGTTAEAAWGLLVSRGERRRAVVDEDGVLVGLLCLKRSQDGFCSDADVLARAVEARALARSAHGARDVRP